MGRVQFFKIIDKHVIALAVDVDVDVDVDVAVLLSYYCCVLLFERMYVTRPRPQHIKSQPSTPMDVSLHCRPCVPWMPKRRFFSQKLGEGSKYTISLIPGAFGDSAVVIPTAFGLTLAIVLALPLGRMLLVIITREAPSKRSLRLSPITRKFAKRIQHVFTVHEPDMP
uniref:Uncharacterized protein n=1 Tax=Glossina pallidipes TaxID=7398 RepID=A0A1A9Z608_GLOPL